MKDLLNRPKYFGEILDVTFKLSKNNFVKFMKIFLILVGPIYLIDALVNLSAGTSFFRELGTGSNWFEQVLNSLEDGAGGAEAATTLAEDLWFLVLGLFSLVLYLVAQGAILYAVNFIRKGEEFTAGQVIKMAFTRFFPMLFSGIWFFIILMGLIIIPVVVIGIAGFVGFSANPIIGGVLVFFMVIGFLLGIGLMVSRLYFYLGSVVLDKVSPGIIRSWQLSKNRTWAIFGLLIIFSVIIGFISSAVELSFGLLLGYSVLFMLISNLVLLFTTMIFSVGYAVIFLDLKARHHGDDLKEMIEDYKS